MNPVDGFHQTERTARRRADLLAVNPDATPIEISAWVNAMSRVRNLMKRAAPLRRATITRVTSALLFPLIIAGAVKAQEVSQPAALIPLGYCQLSVGGRAISLSSCAPGSQTGSPVVDVVFYKIRGS